jgi:hypothetical protein
MEDNKGLEITALSASFFSFLYIVISVIYRLNIAGEIQCFGLVFSVRRSENNNTTNTTSNNNISVGNSNNNNDITQEVEIEIVQNDENI